MSWPQIIMASLMVLKVLVGICCNGEKRDNVNGAAFIADVAVYWIILDQGGFWA